MACRHAWRHACAADNGEDAAAAHGGGAGVRPHRAQGTDPAVGERGRAWAAGYAPSPAARTKACRRAGGMRPAARRFACQAPVHPMPPQRPGLWRRSLTARHCPCPWLPAGERLPGCWRGPCVVQAEAAGGQEEGEGGGAAAAAARGGGRGWPCRPHCCPAPEGGLRVAGTSACTAGALQAERPDGGCGGANGCQDCWVPAS